MTQDINDIIGWDQPLPDVQQDEALILEPGIYTFEVKSYERKIFGDSSKMAGIPYAEMKLMLFADNGVGFAKVNFPMKRNWIWKLRQLFQSCGFAVKQGQDFVPQWNLLIGSGGKCEVEPRTWINGKGEKLQSNDVKKFLMPVAEDDVPNDFDAF